MRTPTLAVLVQLPLIWNTYLLFNTDIVNFVCKTGESEVESIALFFVFFLVVLESSMDDRWCGGAESLI